MVFIFVLAGSLLLSQTLSSCGKWGYSLVEVCGALIAVASFVVDSRLEGMQASVVVSWL